MRPMFILAGALAAGALFAGLMALPDWDAATFNAEMRQGCAEIRTMRPAARCDVPLRRETIDMQWVLIAVLLACTAAVTAALDRKGRA